MKGYVHIFVYKYACAIIMCDHRYVNLKTVLFGHTRVGSTSE